MSKKTVILVTRAGLGKTTKGDEAFGSEMLDKFFHTLESQPLKPHAICFYTEGARVACEGSPHLLGLGLLAGLGVRLVTCRTCLEHYGLAAELAVGEAGGMVEIVSLLNEADTVITV